MVLPFSVARQIILLAMLASMFSFQIAQAQVATSSTSATSTPENISAPASSYVSHADVETRVRSYFADAPVMIGIAKCESEFRQFNTDGSVLHGGAGHSMIGVYQINDSVHRAYAKSIGMDIDTLDGNLAYAKKLYTDEGTGPWLSSFSCWKKENPESETVTTQQMTAMNSALSHDLSLGTISQEVVTLQQVLNRSGFALADSGPGSPGQETSKYGSLTRDAVRKFQCAKSIICTGDEYTTGFGFVGARTRAALSALAPSMATADTSQSHTAPNPEVAAAASNDAQIAQLRARIVDLTRLLNDLIAAQSHSIQ
jgi:hypothetical protein